MSISDNTLDVPDRPGSEADDVQREYVVDLRAIVPETDHKKKLAAQAVQLQNDASFWDGLYRKAKWLHDVRIFYYPYAILDGLSLSYSMLKYSFNMLNINSDTALHDFLLKPQGITTVVLESLFLIGFSFLACYFDKEKENELKQWIAKSWPYVRDILKAAKNSYKGLKSTFKVSQLLGAQNLSPLLIPISLTIGVIGALNRVGLRFIRSERKDWQVLNIDAKSDLLEKLSSQGSLSEQCLNECLDQLKYHGQRKQNAAYAMTALGAAVDSLYLYAGIITLAPVGLSLLWPLAVLSLFYTACLLVSRLYEEQLYQQKFLRSALDCKLLIQKQKLLNKYKDPDASQEAIETLITELCETYQQLQQMNENSVKLAILAGIRHGLYAYSAAACALFMVAGFLVLGGVAFPPLLMVLGAASGFIFMAGYIIYALYEHHQQQKAKEASTSIQHIKSLDDLKEKVNEAVSLPRVDEVERFLNDGLELDSTPQFFVQEWFEVFRSFFSGFSKGQRAVDFTMNPLQELDSHGDYKDSRLMIIFMAISCPVLGAAWFVRAFARGFKDATSADTDRVDETDDIGIIEDMPDAMEVEEPPPGEKLPTLLTSSSSCSSLSSTCSFTHMQNDGIKKSTSRGKAEPLRRSVSCTDFSLFKSKKIKALQLLESSSEQAQSSHDESKPMALTQY